MTEKKTAGQLIVEHDAKGLGFDDDVIEYRRQMEYQMMREIQDTAQRSKNHSKYLGKNFYVVMLNSVDKVLRQPRTVIFARESCPTPVYKQSVWKYCYNSDSLEFMWSIPDSILYYHIIQNKAKYLLDKECSDLAKFVVLMESGDLLDWVKKENGEKIDALINVN